VGKGGGGKRRVIDYHINMHWGVCWGPVDSIEEIRFKEKVAFSGSVSSNNSLYIDEPELFGGDEAEGGVRGYVDFMLGDSGQVLSDVTAGQLGLTSSTAPGFRGITSLWFHNGDVSENRGFMISQNNPYISTLDVRVARYSRHPNLNVAHDLIGDDANPAHMIFEIYTNNDWGLGWPVAAFNLTSWRAVAETLFDENFGLSMMWVTPGEVEAFVAEIIDHIQATIYTDPTTGLVEIKLLRDDYDLLTAKTFSPDNCTLEDTERRALEDTVNEISVVYTDPETEEELTLQVQDLANIAAQNGLIKGDSRNYYGVRNAELAWSLGERDLREASYPLFSTKIIADRSQGQIIPGEVIELQWPEEGITSMACRVLDIANGKKGDGKMILSVAEDIWSLDRAEFEVPPTTNWELPSVSATAFAQQSAITAPYPVLSRQGLTPAYADVYVGLLGQQNDLDTESFTLTTEVVNPAGDTVEANYSGMLQAPFGVLAVAFDAEVESVVAEADMPAMSNDFGSYATGQLFYIGDSTDDTLNEIVMLKSYSVGNWTIKRGIWDTVPRAWPLSTEVWYFSTSFSAADPNVRSAGAPVSYWLRPKTLAGTLPKLSAVELVYTPSERPHLPFRPANVGVSGDTGFGLLDLGTPAPFTVSWANRNRALEDTVALHWDEASVAVETGQTTTIQFLDASDDSMIVQYVGLTGSSFEVPSGGGPTTAWSTKMRVFSVRDGLESLQYFERLVDIDFDFAGTSGYGSAYGETYGTGA